MKMVLKTSSFLSHFGQYKKLEQYIIIIKAKKYINI